MRDWNFFSPLSFGFAERCELNLWGIETNQPRLINGANGTVWIEPVRDWNPSPLVYHFLINACELNLWGIETVFLIENPIIGLLVWIEPVRDWNVNCYLGIPLRCFGVNWTCEGLKQSSKIAFSKGLWSVNWTCEGLKHPLTAFCNVFCQGVNWTCEGLKQSEIANNRNPENSCELNLWGIETYPNFLYIPKFSFVWIEPVRDWNGTARANGQVPDYVWIEPVRDWNCDISSYCNGKFFGVNWTCEGLKPGFFAIIFYYYWVWIEPVRDWNKIIFPCLKYCSYVWIEPVRDWNEINILILLLDLISVNWTCEGLKQFFVF